MRAPMTFPIACEGRSVELQTTNYWREVDGSQEVTHFRANCTVCGKEHVGYSLPVGEIPA